MPNQFVGYDNIIPLLAPQNIASTITATSYMDIKNAVRAGFLVSWGTLTTASASDTYVITMECASSDNAATEATIGFRYRKSGAVGTNTWAAVTSAASTGLSIASTDDDKLVWIEVEPDALMADNENYRFVRLRITDTDDMAAGTVGVAGFIQARYAQTTHISATASASA